MIEFRQVGKADWRGLRPNVLRLMRAHGDRHITPKALRHVRDLRSSQVAQEGNVVVTAWSEQQLIGVIVCEQFGKRTSAAVVHPSFRSQGVGRGLLHRALRQLGRFYGEIAADNLASLRHAFAAGMIAYDAFIRRGKVTLRVRNGFEPD